MKVFNTTAVCIPSKHYMVDLSRQLEEMKRLVDAGAYFTVNRARQYGKTTTLAALRKYLAGEYQVFFLDFQGISASGFASEGAFVQEFSRLLWKNRREIPEEIGLEFQRYQQGRQHQQQNRPSFRLGEMFETLQEWCRLSEKPIVLIIDEVDSATNNQVFLDFLSQLREGYIRRDMEDEPTFQSVILSGVTDVKHLRGKIREEDRHRVNSPWNIAADFDVDMSLSEEGIKDMLEEYEADHHTGMDAAGIAKQIRAYTNGYPYLVSRICQLMDTRLVPGSFADLPQAWTAYGVEEAVKLLLSEGGDALFDSLMGKLVNYPELGRKLRAILLRGETFAWLPYDGEQRQLYMYGFIRNVHNTVAVANRIFEMLLYAHFIGESKQNEALKQAGYEGRSIFVDQDGWLDVPKIMEHFIREHNRIHGGSTEKFLEMEGRERFLTYVSAIINGTGTYSIEEQTRSSRRMDLVIHYLGRRYIVELKIWRGERYNAEGEKQISAYLDYFGLNVGYMLSFHFHRKKIPGVKRVNIGNKVLFEGTV